MRHWIIPWLLLAPLSAVVADAAEAPSLELLEFLGHWESAETDKGEWQDPLEVMQELDALDKSELTAQVEASDDGQTNHGQDSEQQQNMGQRDE